MWTRGLKLCSLPMQTQGTEMMVVKTLLVVGLFGCWVTCRESQVMSPEEKTGIRWKSSLQYYKPSRAFLTFTAMREH